MDHKALRLAFRRDDQAVSAVEFAIIFPVMLMLMLGGIQLVVYINAVRKVELLASAISETISQTPTPNSQTTTATVTPADLHFTYDSAIVIFPYLLKDAASKGILWWQDIVIDYASVQFTQTSTSCGTNPDQSACYTANVVWTSSERSETIVAPAHRRSFRLQQTFLVVIHFQHLSLGLARSSSSMSPLRSHQPSVQTL